MTLLPRQWYAREVRTVACALLGQHLVRETDRGRIVVRLTEVEAYAGADDPGSHSYRGRTQRNEVMFGPAGVVYVYFTYGMHHCVNIVTGPDGQPSAVLLRAGEVIEGEALARERRGAVPARDLARGPARLTVALDIDKRQYGADVTDPGGELSVHQAPAVPATAIASGPRVGVAGEGGVRPWRYWIDGDRTVSPYRAAVVRPR